MSALGIAIPDTGLSLRRGGDPSDVVEDHHQRSSTKPSQIMRLNLAQNILDDLIQSLRNDHKVRIRLGKHQTIYYASKSQHFHSVPETHRSEIYTSTADDKENLYFSGLLSHSLEVQKAQEATAATDQALANLEQSLHAFEKGKESKKTHMITDIDQVRALKAGNHRSPRIPPRRIDLEKDRLLNRQHNNPASRSSSSSPLGLSRSPLSLPALTPTSAPLPQNKDRIRLDALKVPFIHLLAVRAVSAKFIARQTRSSLEDCQALARKYGIENRLDREKFDLKDKAYRELDVWNFPYPSQADRQEAIENAISAFDRMRISRSDKLWQVLLPKEDRDKGKVLSRLDLRTGPVKKPPTPRIQVQGSEDAGNKDGDTTGNETDRANKKDDGLAPRTTEKTTTAATAAPKPGTAAAKKKRPGEKDASSKRTSAKGKTPNNNSTLTGRVTKKAEKKPPTSKVKSAEFVHDSDEEEDVDMPDATSTSSTSSSTAKQRQAEQKRRMKSPPASNHNNHSNINDNNNDNKRAVSHAAAPPKVAKSNASPSQRQQPFQATTNAATTSQKFSSSSSSSLSSSLSQLSKPTTTATTTTTTTTTTSPRKPSPLGSSPLINASESRGHSRSSSRNTATSSSSSSPLITQVSRPRKANGATASGTSNLAKPNGVVKPHSEGAATTLKRKAESQRPSMTDSSRPTGRVNGHVEHKRQRAASTSSGSTSSGSPSMGREVLRRQLQEKSHRFKQHYAKYRSLHDSLASQARPPRTDLDKLQQQHNRLQRMKKEIWDEDRRLREGRLES